MDTIRLDKGYTLQRYFGSELSVLPETTLTDIANCYMTVYNESWGENWDITSALEEVKRSFEWSDKRIPIGTLLFKDKKVIGFCWGLLTDANNLYPNRDMPFALSLDKKEKAVKVIRYWLNNVIKKDKLLIYRELGALKEHRGKLAPYLIHYLLEASYDHGYKTLIYWTNPKSETYSLGIGVGWNPIYFFMEEKDLMVSGGSVKYALDMVSKAINNDTRDGAYEKAAVNYAKYHCEL